MRVQNYNSLNGSLGQPWNCSCRSCFSSFPLSLTLALLGIRRQGHRAEGPPRAFLDAAALQPLPWRLAVWLYWTLFSSILAPSLWWFVPHIPVLLSRLEKKQHEPIFLALVLYTTCMATRVSHHTKHETIAPHNTNDTLNKVHGGHGSEPTPRVTLRAVDLAELVLHLVNVRLEVLQVPQNLLGSLGRRVHLLEHLEYSQPRRIDSVERLATDHDRVSHATRGKRRTPHTSN